MAYTDLFTPSPWRRFFERHPSAMLWLIAAGQALAMLGISILLRSLAS
jgi:hypothetical protein